MNNFFENIIVFIVLPIFLFFIFLKPILPTETKFKEVLSPLETARINIKNFGSTNNAVKITQLNKNNAKIWEPLWYVDF